MEMIDPEYPTLLAYPRGPLSDRGRVGRCGRRGIKDGSLKMLNVRVSGGVCGSVERKNDDSESFGLQF